MAEYYSAGDPRVHGHIAGYGAVTGYMQVGKGPASGRNALGRFTSFQGKIKDAFRIQAESLQEMVADNIDARYQRPGVSTGRLYKATMDARNRRVNVDGFYVGIEDWMAKSQAKYWRTIEFGSEEVWSHPFVGTILKGWFGESKAGFYENAWGTVLMAGPEFTKPGDGTGGKFRPYNRATAQALKGHARSGRGVVRQEIEPMHAYRDAWEDLGGARPIAQETLDILRRIVE